MPTQELSGTRTLVTGASRGYRDAYLLTATGLSPVR